MNLIGMFDRNSRRITNADRRRFEALRELGCSACGSAPQAGALEVHHLLSGNKRRGHSYTICLCSWHHRGEPLPGYTAKQMAATFGPSLARNSKAFRAVYGSDDTLLAIIDARLEELSKLRVA